MLDCIDWRLDSSDSSNIILLGGKGYAWYVSWDWSLLWEFILLFPGMLLDLLMIWPAYLYIYYYGYYYYNSFI